MSHLDYVYNFLGLPNSGFLLPSSSYKLFLTKQPKVILLQGSNHSTAQTSITSLFILHTKSKSSQGPTRLYRIRSIPLCLLFLLLSPCLQTIQASSHTGLLTVPSTSHGGTWQLLLPTMSPLTTFIFLFEISTQIPHFTHYKIPCHTYKFCLWNKDVLQMVSTWNGNVTYKITVHLKFGGIRLIKIQSYFARRTFPDSSYNKKC